MSSDDSETKLRVLFVHGLGGSPTGRKVQMMRRAGFEVHALKLPLYNWSSIFRNVPLMLAACIPLLTICGLGGIGVFMSRNWARVRNDWSLLGLVGFCGLSTVSIAYWITRRLLRHSVRFVLTRCLQQQREAIAEFQPDVVAGVCAATWISTCDVPSQIEYTLVYSSLYHFDWQDLRSAAQL